MAVSSVLTQELPQAAFEVVVVNDSGRPLAAAEWHASPRVEIIDTNRCERSFARNSGAAVARGRYLAFLDDDDWILPGALEQFWQLAARFPQAGWLYGGIQIVDGQSRVLAEINTGFSGNCFAQIMGGSWAPIQSSMIQAGAFLEAGGYSPLICGTEDEDLCRRIAARWDFASTPQPVACLFRGDSWNTSTNYLRAPEDTKFSRDLILGQPGVFRRLQSSAQSAYWRGRNLRVYFSTVAYNMKKKRRLAALSRLMYGLGVVAGSLRWLPARDFWAGLRADHVPQTLHFVMQEYEKARRKK